MKKITALILAAAILITGSCAATASAEENDAAPETEVAETETEAGEETDDEPYLKFLSGDGAVEIEFSGMSERIYLNYCAGKYQDAKVNFRTEGQVTIDCDSTYEFDDCIALYVLSKSIIGGTVIAELVDGGGNVLCADRIKVRIPFYNKYIEPLTRLLLGINIFASLFGLNIPLNIIVVLGLITDGLK